MNFDRTGIDGGEEILSEIRREAERQQGCAEEAAGKPEAMLQRQAQQSHVSRAQPLEMMFEPELKLVEKADRGGIVRLSVRCVMMLIAQEKVRHRRHQRVGQDI